MADQTAKSIAKEANQAAAEANKGAAATAEAPAPKKVKKKAALNAPIVNLPDDIRGIISQYCFDTDKAFAQHTIEMWIEKLKAEKKLPADFKYEPRRGGGGGGASKAKLEKAEEEKKSLLAEIEALKAQLANQKK